MSLGVEFGFSSCQDAFNFVQVCEIFVLLKFLTQLPRLRDG